MEFSEFVSGFKAGQVRVHVDRSAAMHICDKWASLPPRYRRAHALWKYVSFILLLGGLASLFWVPWWAGLGAAVLGIAMAPAVQKSAGQFVLEYSLQNEHFFRQMIDSGVMSAEVVDGK